MPIYNWLADAERRGKGRTVGTNGMMAAARSSGCRATRFAYG